MRDHSVEDFLRMKTISNVTLSQDGAKLAYIVSNTYKEYREQIENRIVLRDLVKESEETITGDCQSASSASFSPDGKKLAYICSEKDVNSVELVDLESLSRERSMVRGKLSGLKWQDSTSMILLVEDHHPEEKNKKKTGDDGYFFEEDHKFQSLWKYTPGSGMKRITSGFQVWDFSANSNNIVAITSDFPYNWSWYRSSISLIDIENGERSEMYVPEKRQLSSPAFSGDGKRVYFMESLMSDNGVESGDIISCDLSSGEWTNLTEDQDRTFSCFVEDEKGELYTLSNRMGTFGIHRVDGSGSVWSSYGSVVPAFSPKFSYGGGRFALGFTSRDQPQEVFIINEKGKSDTVSSVNSELSDLKSYSSTPVKWNSEDGMEIYGLFRDAGKNSPLVVIVHGGPTHSNTEAFMDLSTLLLGAGFSVFLPNYRGSTGMGRKYAELNRGDMGGMDFTDIMTGLDHIIKTNAVDRDRIYITGGSYGGFMSAWAITQTSRFKAAVSLFGISDWVSFHGVSSLADWDSMHYDQDPYEFDRFQKFSAIRYIDNVKTPVLLMHGIEDPYVPVGQYYQFYRALKDKKKEARLLLFPREGHGFREKHHFVQYITEMIDYFKDHS